MKSQFSWEMAAVGLLIIAVSIWLTTSKNDNQTDLREPGLANVLNEEPEQHHRASADQHNGKPSGMDTLHTPAEPAQAGNTVDQTAAASPADPAPDALNAAADTAPRNGASGTAGAVETDSAARSFDNSAVTNAATSDNNPENSAFNQLFDPATATLIAEERFDAFAVASVEVDAAIGHIQIRSHSGSEIIVQIWLAEGLSEQDFNRYYRSEIARSPEKIQAFISNRQQDESWIDQLSRLWNSTEGSTTVRAGIRITIPEGALTSTAKTGAGNIEAAHTGGDINLNTTAGNITLTGLFGRTVAETTAGNIRADALQGTIALRTRAGNIVAENLDANTELRTIAGNISASAVGATQRMDLESRVGNVSLIVPAQVNGDLRMDGSTVDLHEAFAFEGEREDRFIRGTINGGGPLLRIHSGIGNASLNIPE